MDYPGTHFKGPVASEQGFLVGSETVVDADGTWVGEYDTAGMWKAMLESATGVGKLLESSTNGTVTMLDADGSTDRDVTVIVRVTEEFKDVASDNQPTFKIGEADTVEKFLKSAALTGAKVGDSFVIKGVNTKNKALIVTATKATGASTGAINVLMFAAPVPAAV